MNEVHEAIREMVAWERGVPHRIQHFLKVHSLIREPLLCSTALRMKFRRDTPGTSRGFWKDRKIPSLALWSAVSSNNSFPLNRISPPVTS